MTNSALDKKKLELELCELDRKLAGSRKLVSDLLGQIDQLKLKYKTASFWNETVYPDGMTAEQVENELHDFYVVMTEVPKVYQHVTCNRISKPLTHASAVISEANDCWDKWTKEAIKEETTEMQDEIEILKGERDRAISKQDTTIKLLNSVLSRVGHWMTLYKAEKAAQHSRTMQRGANIGPFKRD